MCFHVCCALFFFFFFFFKQKTAYEIRLSLVGSEMCIRDSSCTWGVGSTISHGKSGRMGLPARRGHKLMVRRTHPTAGFAEQFLMGCCPTHLSLIHI